jgi:nitrogen fixation/metabolism regulation signal transduction histidine kinase
MDAPYRRSKKNLWLMPGFQGRLILLFVLGAFGCALFNGYLYYAYVDDSYAFIFRYSTLAQELIDQRHRDLLVFGIALAAGSLVITLLLAAWALVLTHRAAGAVYHIKKVIGEIKAGNVTRRVHLRKKDEFQDLAAAFNQLMDELQAK